VVEDDPVRAVVLPIGAGLGIAINIADHPDRGVQRYTLHCHNLEHEDQGMMVTFAVAD